MEFLMGILNGDHFKSSSGRNLTKGRDLGYLPKWVKSADPLGSESLDPRSLASPAWNPTSQRAMLPAQNPGVLADASYDGRGISLKLSFQITEISIAIACRPPPVHASFPSLQSWCLGGVGGMCTRFPVARVSSAHHSRQPRPKKGRGV